MTLRRVFFCLVPLCIVSLGVSLWFLFSPLFLTPEPTPQPMYILSEENGHLAVFDSQGPSTNKALKVYPVYVRLLPENDQRRLVAGMEIYSDAQLQQRLEDYGL